MQNYNKNVARTQASLVLFSVSLSSVQEPRVLQSIRGTWECM